ncbi:hypothetical protein DPMN_010436 [Dreissena polymorpha]|uniref:Kazal-like domain-containing protein n=1 Tax=Dreissena polymorpha TaxID=45954 RepID=A0A9D4N357_DREPO|nr:hypothetical protein DPMN_010436 [Dreissena polymorpha]
MNIAILMLATIVGVHCGVFSEKRQTHCSTFCPMYIIEFCGSDGKTYNSNPCFIQSRMCSQGVNGYENFKVVHYGACKDGELATELPDVITTTEDLTIG